MKSSTAPFHIAITLLIGLLAPVQAPGQSAPKEVKQMDKDPAIKDSETVSLTGKLRGGLMAIGGETTGWELTYSTPAGSEKIEVDMKAIKGITTAPAEEVTLTGQILIKKYVERGNVRILKAATLSKSAGKER